MNDVTTIKDYPTNISIRAVNSTTYEVSVEYEDFRQNYTEVIGAFSGNGKYINIIKLMTCYSRDRITDTSTEECL